MLSPMKKIFIFLLISLFSFSNSHASWKKTSWKVIKVVGDPIYADSKDYIGKIQQFGMGGRGKDEGIFWECPFAGGSTTDGNVYSYDEFLKIKDFKRFKKYKDKIKLPKDKKILVERASCEINKRVLYPFIQIEGEDIAYYEFDMAIFILENINK